MWVIVISLGTHLSTGENIGCTSECHQSNAAIRNILPKMPECWWIFMRRTAGYLYLSGCTQVIDFPQPWTWFKDYWLLSLLNHSSYYFYQHWIMHLTTFRNQRKWQVNKQQCRYTKTITGVSNQMISLDYGVNVIHYFSHLVWADECRNTWFINGTRKVQALLVFPNYSYLASAWNGIRMLFGSICDIYHRWNVILARCKSKRWFDRQYMDEKGSNHQEKRSIRWAVLYGKEEYTDGVEIQEREISGEECWQGLRSTHTNRAAPLSGVRSADWNRGVPIHAAEHWWGSRSAFPTDERRQWAVQGE